MHKLKIISSTVRPGRKGPIVASWILEEVKKSGLFEAELVDLGELALPVMNEPVHPVMRQYEHQHTKDWSVKIAEADAFIFVTAEYDYSYPAPLKNALEYLVHEWGIKPAGIVSYSGGPFGGVRAVNNLKADLLMLKIVSIHEGVVVPSLNQFMDENNVFTASEQLVKNAGIMLKSLERWTRGLNQIRQETNAGA
jgi:NAD(P)H-dependent FMN reductase